MNAKKIGLILGCIVGVVLVGMLTVFLLEGGKSSKKEDKTMQVETSETTEALPEPPTEQAATEEATEEVAVTEEPQLDESWKKQYYELIKTQSLNFTNMYDAATGETAEDKKGLYVYLYALAYLDADEIPELVVYYLDLDGMGWESALYTCIDGSVKTVLDREWKRDVEYVEREGKILLIDMAGYGARDYSYYHYENGEISLLLETALADEDVNYEDFDQVDGFYIGGGQEQREVSKEEYLAKRKELGFASLKALDWIDGTKENVIRSFGTEEEESSDNVDWDVLLRNYLDKYIEMVNSKDYSVLQDYVYTGKKVTKGYSVEQQMKNQAKNEKVVSQTLKECSVEEVILKDETTCRIRTHEVYDAVYRKSLKEMKAETNSNAKEFCSQHIAEGASEDSVYEVSEIVDQRSYYELKKTKKGEWKFYRFMEPVEQKQEVYDIR